MLTRAFTLRFFFGLGLSVVIVLLAIFNTLLVWVATGPRVLDDFTPYIEEALSAKDGSYHVKIKHTTLFWDGWKNPVDIKLENVRLVTAQGNGFSSFPDISLGIDIPSALIGKISPTKLVINKPTISLLQYSDYSIGIGYNRPPSGEDDSDKKVQKDISPAAIILAAFSDKDSHLSTLRRLSIVDGNINIRDQAGNVLFDAKNTNINFIKTDQHAVQMQATSMVGYGNNKTKISANSTLDRERKYATGGVQFDEIIPAQLETIFFGSRKLEKLTTPTHGGMQFKLRLKDNYLEELGFQLTGKQGKIEHEMLAGAILFDQFELHGKITENLSQLHIERFISDVDGINLSASGDVSLTEPFTAKGKVKIEHADSKDIALLWPPHLSPVSRNWIISNITAAEIPMAELTVNIQTGDLKQPVLPRDALDATIHMKNAAIRYLPEHPPVKNLSAIVRVNAVGLTTDISHADFMKNTTLSSGKVIIADLNADNPRISVTFDAEGSAPDAVRILKLPRLSHAKRLGLKENIKGSLTAKATLSFDFYAERDENGELIDNDNVIYDVTTHIKNITQQGVLHRFDLKDSSGTLRVKNGSVVFIGAGNVNNADVQELDVKYLFTPQDGLDTFIKVQADTPVSSFPRFGYPAFDFLAGRIGIHADIEQGPKKERATATLDLRRTEVTKNPLSWLKPAGKDATLDLQVFKQDGKINIPSFRLKGAGADLNGTMSLNKTLTAIDSLTLQTSTIGENKIKKLAYKKTENAFTLELQAETLNLENYLQDNKDDKGFSLQNFPAIEMNAKINTLILATGYPIREFSGRIHCNIMLCESADITGKPADSTFRFQILKNPKGKRQLSFHGDNAGLLLKSVGIYDGMEKGLLTISGNFDDNGKTSSSLKGRLVIGRFVLKDAPVLAKILSLASLTGFFDTLQGNGITFKQLSVPFNLEGDVITIKKAKAVGAAIGLTADGDIAMPHVMLNIAGTVVPSYTLNSTFGKVPLLGPLLTGGENSGVFAARYSVNGSYKAPKVSVNPLSMLTPGFLRNLFDIFDKPKKKKK